MFEQQPLQEEPQFVVPPHPELEFKATPTIEKPIQASLLVIATYGPAGLFAHALPKTTKPTYRVNFLKSKQTSLADIYIDEATQTVYIIFNAEVEKMKEVHFVKSFLKSSINASNTILLTSEYLNNLEQSATNSASKTCLQKPSCQPHKEGLQGICAEVLIWGQINRKPVCCFIGLFKDYELNYQIIQEVFGGLIGKHSLARNNEIGDRIKKYNMKKYSNTLYL